VARGRAGYPPSLRRAFSQAVKAFAGSH
jgi:hypothetical protein